MALLKQITIRQSIKFWYNAGTTLLHIEVWKKTVISIA